jgi:hypothetical protein
LTNYSAVINDPTSGEAANKDADIHLQTRQFVYDFLSAKFDSAASDVLKVAAVADATLAGKVKGSTSNSGTQQGIVQGTVSTPDLRDLAVSAAKIAADAVTTVKIGDLQVTTAKINDAAVTTAKIQDAQVTTAKLATDSVDNTILKDTAGSEAVTTAHIRDSAVTTAKILDNNVTRAKLFTATEAQILVYQADSLPTAKTMSGDATINASGVLSLAVKGYAQAIEQPGSGTAGGAAVATTWNLRGDATAWSEISDSLNLMSIGTGADKGKITMSAGTYLVRAHAPAYKTDAHMLRLRRFNSGGSVQETIYGTSETSPAATAQPTRSFLSAKVTFAAGDYVQLEHYTVTARAADGLGLGAAIATIPESYAMIDFSRIP